MAEGISPIDLRLAQVLGEDEFSTPSISPSSSVQGMDKSSDLYTNPFEQILSKAVDAMSEVSKTEAYANQLIDKYTKGQADLQDVMIASSKASVMVQMAVTTINLAVNTFKEITQIQI